MNDAALFIGFAAPNSIGDICKFREELQGLFRNYKKGFPDMPVQSAAGTAGSGSSPREEFKDYMYKPAIYVTFGQFDFVALALIDDFEIATNTFHPLDPDWPTDSGLSRYPNSPRIADHRTFYHQYITGPLPRFGLNSARSPVQLALNTFLDPNPLPLVGICQLKLQNGLFIGTGSDFLRCAIKAIRRRFYAYENAQRQLCRDNQNSRRCLRLLIAESFSWHEITIVVFGNSFHDIVQFILDVREMTVGRMEHILEDEHARVDQKTGTYPTCSGFERASHYA